MDKHILKMCMYTQTHKLFTLFWYVFSFQLIAMQNSSLSKLSSFFPNSVYSCLIVSVLSHNSLNSTAEVVKIFLQYITIDDCTLSDQFLYLRRWRETFLSKSMCSLSSCQVLHAKHISLHAWLHLFNSML